MQPRWKLVSHLHELDLQAAELGTEELQTSDLFANGDTAFEHLTTIIGEAGLVPFHQIDLARRSVYVAARG